MTLRVCLPWQLAERDTSYYTRTRELLGWPQWYSWKADCIGMDGFTPMVWQVRHGPLFTRHIEHAQAQRGRWSRYFLGNEPERSEQSNTSPAEFAEAIRTWLSLAGGAWAGPGILWSDGGRAWIDGYLAADGPIPDIWAIHIYGSTWVKDWLKQYRHAQRWFAERAQRPIWVTETNAYGNEAIQEGLMRYLARDHEIVAFWYASHATDAHRVANLHDRDGQLTALGRVYAELQAAAGATKEHNTYMPFLPG